MAGVEVLGTVARSRVNDAAALIEGDVVGKNAGHVNGKKWVLKFHAIKIAALEGGANFGFFDPAFGLKRRNAFRGEKQCAFFGFDDGVFEVGMKGERAIVGNGPRRSGPDNGADIGSDFRGFASAAHDSRELHPD